MHRAHLRPTLVLIALLTLVTLPAPPVSADTTFTNRGSTVRFQVPDGWKMGAVPADAAEDVVPTSWTTTNPAGNVALSVTPTFVLRTFLAVDGNGLITPDFLAAQAAAGAALGAQTSASNYALQRDPISLSIAGEPANELDYIGQDAAGNPSALDLVSVAQKDTTYVLLFAAPPADIAALRAAGTPILTSWQWLGATQPGPSRPEVTIYDGGLTDDFVFNPLTISVKVGDTVTWTNIGGLAHTITAADGSFDSGLVNPLGTFSHTFASAGTYSYVCKQHYWMKATVTVS